MGLGYFCPPRPEIQMVRDCDAVGCPTVPPILQAPDQDARFRVIKDKSLPCSILLWLWFGSPLGTAMDISSCIWRSYYYRYMAKTLSEVQASALRYRPSLLRHLVLRF